jgi:hypothetical protein
VSSDFPQQLTAALRGWWREQAQAKGALEASSLLLRELWGFVRDSAPDRRRQRYGDMNYDWEQHVNTTSGTVSWRERLLGTFHSAYQPSDPAMFHEMMAALPIDFREFTFIDIGAGKGRTLLMASEYPFKRIVGVELLAELHRAAEENIAAYQSGRHPSSTPDATIEAVRMDAREFVFPETPLVVFLFNPLAEAGLRKVIRNLEQSLERAPRPAWIVYHNPVLESVLRESPFLAKELGRAEFSLFQMRFLKPPDAGPA